MRILITGCAGFIGFSTSKKLLERGDKVVGIDNLNNYYDVKLKKARLKKLKKFKNFKFYKNDLSKGIKIKDKIDVICHLGAQVGVRYSIKTPLVYEKANMVGTLEVFEFARRKKIGKIVYASSSSVYGNDSKAPFNEKMQLDKPVSLYAATKKANELYAYVYYKLYGIKMIGLRFFTVYGPWGRPDMALFKFTKKILNGETIDVYNHGKMRRDFTYIGDIVEGVIKSLDKDLDFEIFNLARGETIKLMDFIKEIENVSGKKAKMNFMPMQQGDVLLTSGDISHAKRVLKYEPKVSIKEGIKRFVDWYRRFYKIK